MKMRKFGLTYVDQAIGTIRQIEKQVPSRYWMDIPQADQDKYHVMMQQARIQLTNDGVYDPKMMALLKRVRCHHNAKAAECSTKDE